MSCVYIYITLLVLHHIHLHITEIFTCASVHNNTITEWKKCKRCSSD